LTFRIARVVVDFVHLDGGAAAVEQHYSKRAAAAHSAALG
jgi:hypothetical protein